MASKNAASAQPNLASLLLIKRKMAANENPNGNARLGQLQPPQNATGAHSNDKLNYRQDAPVPDSTITPAPKNTSEQPKASRKAKQLEVSLLDKKIEEINRKQEAKANETVDTWKSFDTFNYKITSASVKEPPTPVPPRTPPIVPKTQPVAPVKEPEKPVTKPLQQEPLVKQQPIEKHQSPPPKQAVSKRPDSSRKDRPKSKSPVKKEEPRPKTPLQQKPTEKQSSPPPKKKAIEKQPSPPPQKKPIERQSTPPPQKKPIERQSTPPPQKAAIEKQPTPPPPRRKSVEKQPTPPPPRRKSIEKQPSPPPPKQKIVERQSTPPLPPPRRNIFERQPSIHRHPPSPPPRRFKTNSASSLKKAQSLEPVHRRSDPPTPSYPVIQDVIPIRPLISTPPIFEKNVQPFESSFTPAYPPDNFKVFPNTKPKEVAVTRNAYRSIQRSMDRYRFHVW